MIYDFDQFVFFEEPFYACIFQHGRAMNQKIKGKNFRVFLT